MGIYLQRKLPLLTPLHVCHYFQRCADAGGVNLASNRNILSENRDWKHVTKHFIEEGRVFDDPRRPDLVKFYLQNMKTRLCRSEVSSTLWREEIITPRRKTDQFGNDYSILDFGRTPLQRQLKPTILLQYAAILSLSH